MSGEASEQREKMAEGAWSLFREHSEYKLESHLLGPSCLAVVFTKMGLSNDLFFFSPLEIATQMQWFRKACF